MGLPDFLKLYVSERRITIAVSTVLALSKIKRNIDDL